MSVQDVSLQVALEAIQTNQQVVVDFYSDTCGPCKALAGVLDKVAEQNPETKILKVNVSSQGAGAFFAQEGIRGVPTVLFYKDGKETKRNSGFMPESKFNEVLKGAMS